MRSAPRLVHLTGGRRGAVDALPAEGALVGRDGTRCGVRVDERDDTVSRVHAQVFPAGGSWWVVDRSGRGATAVDGRSAVAPEPLREGSVVHLGPGVRLAFRGARAGRRWGRYAGVLVLVLGLVAWLPAARTRWEPALEVPAHEARGPERPRADAPHTALTEDPLRAAVRRLLSELRGAPHACPIPDAFLEEVRGELVALHRGARAACALRRWREPVRQELRAEAARLGQPASRADALVYLAWVESGFSPHACSHAGARGMWQFIPRTGRRYGLRVAADADTRCHWRDATAAALRYLGDLFQRCGPERPLLAIAGYNTGGTAACRDRGVDPCAAWDFRSFVVRGSLHDETTEYVPRFVAAWLVGEAPAVALAAARARDPQVTPLPSCDDEALFAPPPPRACTTPPSACADRRAAAP